ncbi:MAG: CBS domain-containing protein [Desulfobulbaceae bacterium]|nr:CBS domain-containing protein [Desulfobulbaceae bacterium]
MYVHYYMTASPVTVTPDSTVGDASRLLKEYDIRHLPVVDHKGVLVGMVTDRDIRTAFPSAIVDGDDLQLKQDRVEKIPVADIMSTRTMVLRTVSTLDDAMLFFDKRAIGALPVLDEEEKVVGILSFKDLMKAWKNLFGLGEKGSFLIALEVDQPDQSLTPLVETLENFKIPFNRIIRTDGSGKEPPMIYLQVRTYNIISVHKAVEQAGFRMHVPEDRLGE